MSKEKVNERISSPVGEPNNKKLNKKWIFIIIIILILVGVILFLLTKKSPKPNNVVTPDNVDQIIEEMEERTPAGSYEVSMNTNWEFERGDAISNNAFVQNSASNQNTVYFTVSLKDSDKIVYESPYLEVGSSLKDIQLDSKLAKGTYDAIITYHLVDEDYEELSSVSLYMQIIIKK